MNLSLPKMESEMPREPILIGPVWFRASGPIGNWPEDGWSDNSGLPPADCFMVPVEVVH